MIYRLPEISDKSILQEYMQEHYDNRENSISASLGLPASEYTDWVEKIQRNALVGDEQWGKSLLYLCFDNNKLIGLLSVRYELPENLTKIYGDIGYGVRPSERNKGYATTMLHYALSVCKEKGMDNVLLGCYKDNLASAATIKKNGGVLGRLLKQYGAQIIGGLHLQMPDSIADEKVLKRSFEKNTQLVEKANQKVVKAVANMKKGKYPREGLGTLSCLAGFLSQRLWFGYRTRKYYDER